MMLKMTCFPRARERERERERWRERWREGVRRRRGGPHRGQDRLGDPDLRDDHGQPGARLGLDSWAQRGPGGAPRGPGRAGARAALHDALPRLARALRGGGHPRRPLHGGLHGAPPRAGRLRPGRGLRGARGRAGAGRPSANKNESSPSDCVRLSDM